MSPVILLVYVFWPQRDFLVAAGVALLAALLRLLSALQHAALRRAELWADLATFTVSFVVYAVTLARDVLPADAGEFQLAAALLGVAHPPGYPLYTLIGHLFIRLVPWGNPAYRLNLLSAILAAGTLVLVARAVRLWAGRLGATPLVALAGGLAAVLTLGTATTFWAQATIANVRTPAVFFAALALYALACFAVAVEARDKNRALLLLALALGLGGSHYPPLAFIAVFFILYLLLTDPHRIVQPHRWGKAVLVGLVAFLVSLAYLPIRGAMGAVLAPPGLNTLRGFLWHFTAGGFSGDMFAFANATMLPHRLALIPTLFRFQFNPILLIAALFGLIGLAWRDWRLFVLFAGGLALHTFVTITYRAPQTVEYLMPAYLPIAIAVGLLPASFAHRSSLIAYRSSAPSLPRSTAPLLLCSIALWAGLANGWAHVPSFVELARDTSTRQTVQPLLETAPAGARILADWHWAMPLQYLQQVEGLRPDVEVRYVWPVAGEEYSETWRRLVQETAPGQVLLLTHCYDFAGYTTEPWGAGFLIRPRPVTETLAPLTAVGATFGDAVQVVGYSLRQEHLQPGQAAEITLAWRPVRRLEQTPSFTVRLMDESGTVLAQADRSLSADAAPDEIRFERLVLPLYPTLASASYRVTLGVYTVTDAGFENLTTPEGETATTLTALQLGPLTYPPFTLRRQNVPFTAGPTLIGVDYDRSVPDVLRIYLRWKGPGERQSIHIQDAAVSLPTIPANAYQTVTFDLPGYTSGPLQLALIDDAGRVQIAAGPWGWPLRKVRLPTPLPDARFVPLGDEMAVIGVRAHPADPGETMVVDATLVGLRPLVSDDAISVRLTGGDGRWLDSHDGQPALGAIPTLKWIRGSRITDRHLLHIPADFTGDSTSATLVAYERFRNTIIPSLDERFSAVPLGSWPQPSESLITNH